MPLDGSPLAEGALPHAVALAARFDSSMATHDRRGLARLWLGSVAEAILRHATCPVLLAPGAAGPGHSSCRLKTVANAEQRLTVASSAPHLGHPD
jgi:hypothetical protein